MRPIKNYLKIYLGSSNLKIELERACKPKAKAEPMLNHYQDLPGPQLGHSALAAAI